jgi:hypothetical protein
MIRVLMIFLLISINLNAQLIVNNPDKPLRKDAGRIIVPRQISLAADDNGRFVFKRPYSIIVLGDGSFFLIDNGQVLNFDREGKFSKIIVRKGQGPAEATHLTQLYQANDELYVNTGFMAKLMVFDLNGKLKREHKRGNNLKKFFKGSSFSEGTFRIIGNTKDRNLIVIVNALAEIGTDLKENILLKPVMLLSNENVWKQKLFEIPLKASTFKTPFGKRSFPSIVIKSAADNDNIYFCNKDRFEIITYNISKKQIVSIWKRMYRPVMIPDSAKNKYKFGEGMTVNLKGKTSIYRAPPRKDFPDIQKMFVVNGNLWVFTSTVDKEKGILVDIFNQEGAYLDNFYLSFPGNMDLLYLYRNEFYLNGNHLVTRESDEDGNYKVVKYEISKDSKNRQSKA